MELREFISHNPKGKDGTALDSGLVDVLEHLLRELFGENTSPKIIERFRSKKNIVLHLHIPESNQDLVAKLFITDTFEKEIRILDKSEKHGLSVPKIINSQDNVLLLSFIPGITLVDIVNQTFNQSIIHSLAEWYYLFHSVHSQIKGDPRLRNFIIDNQIIFGLDFEEVRDDHWILDIAGIAASLFDTDPIFDKRKQALAWDFLEKYLSLKHSQRDSAIDQLYTETIVEILKQTSQLRNDPRILDVANTITKNGFGF